MTPDRQRALFAISSLGLGHATRSLIVISDLLRSGYAVTVITTGDALTFLRREIGAEPAVTFLEMADYPPLERGVGWRFYRNLLADLFCTFNMIGKEHRDIQYRAMDFDVIFSDGRYGMCSELVPSYIITHQVSFMPPGGLSRLAGLIGIINLFALRRFDGILIPDYPHSEPNLGGRLAHPPTLACHRHCYVGILSSYRMEPGERDIDYLFIVSGYLLEHKETFIRQLLEQAVSLGGKKVFILGRDADNNHQLDRFRSRDLEIFGLVSGRQRQQLFNRARTVISRSGYSTIMDLVEHDKCALLIPTPNQTEQEYLADHLGERRVYAIRHQQDPLDLAQAIQEAEGCRRFSPPWKSNDSLARIREYIRPMLYKHFFSIIVPAHNEEKELAETLSLLLAQRYPRDRYEILVIENGSSDRTLQLARDVSKKCQAPGVMKVLQSRRGTSAAKNLGIRHASATSEWVIFCDADTHLGPRLLTHLNTWLNRHGTKLAIGTARINPTPRATRQDRLWFCIFNFLHRLTRASFSLQFARTGVARRVWFAEDLQLAEDLKFIRDCRRYGNFFLLPTNQVTTSTRRFAINGYLRQSLSWGYNALLPMRLKRKKVYDVVR